MKRSSWILVAAALAALAAAQGAKTAFRSKDGSASLAPIGQFRISQKKQQLQFTGKGPGLVGIFNELEVRSGQMDGLAERVGNRFSLLQMSTEGATNTVYTQAKNEGTLTSVSAGILYKTAGALDTVALAGDVTLTSAEPVLARNLKMVGRTAQLSLDPKLPGRKRLRRAVLEGPVKIEYRQGAKGKVQASTIDATGSRLVYVATGDRAEMSLSGNVNIVGDGDAFSGTAEANEVVVRFDAEGLVEEVEMKGEPTQTLLNQKKKGNG